MIVLLAIIIFPPTSRGDYNLQLQGDTFNVTWTINASQNITAFSHSLVYPPNLNGSLTGSDLSAFTSALETAVQQKVSSAVVSSVSVHLVSTSPNTSCSTSCIPQWMNATAKFQVREPSQTRNGVLHYDLSWKNIRLNDDLQMAGVSFNRLGEKYIVQALPASVIFQSIRGISWSILINGHSAFKTTYQNLTSSVVLFDMSSIQSPLQNWSHSLDPSFQSQAWSSPISGGSNTSAVETLTESGETSTQVYLSGATVRAEVSAPRSAAVNGDLLFIDLSGGFWDQLILAAVLAPLGILVGSAVLETRVLRRSRPSGKTSKKNK
jgi:hypothetical protein